MCLKLHSLMLGRSTWNCEGRPYSTMLIKFHKTGVCLFCQSTESDNKKNKNLQRWGQIICSSSFYGVSSIKWKIMASVISNTYSAKHSIKSLCNILSTIDFDRFQMWKSVFTQMLIICSLFKVYSYISKENIASMTITPE